MIFLSSSRPAVIARWEEALDSTEARKTFSDLTELQHALGTHKPGLLLLDLKLSGLTTLDDIAAVLNQYPGVKIFVFSDLPEKSEAIRLLKLGIAGYSNTYMAPLLLSAALVLVDSGEVWVGENLMQSLIEDLKAGNDEKLPIPELASLTSREKEIATLVAKGMSNKAIASDLDISERTVKAHLSTIFQKTGKNDRLGLALLVNGYS